MMSEMNALQAHLNSADKPRLQVECAKGHQNYSWRSLDSVTCARFPPGRLVSVSAPNNRKPVTLIPSEMLLANAACIFSAKQFFSHCAHFYFNQYCDRGSECSFIHAVHIDAHAKRFELPSLPDADRRNQPPPLNTEPQVMATTTLNNELQKDRNHIVSCESNEESSISAARAPSLEHLVSATKAPTKLSPTSPSSSSPDAFFHWFNGSEYLWKSQGCRDVVVLTTTNETVGYRNFPYGQRRH